jgi:hypothetical protein
MQVSFTTSNFMPLAGAKQGEFVHIRAGYLHECVCMVLLPPVMRVPPPSHRPPSHPEVFVVVVGCRSGEKEPGYRKPGTQCSVSGETICTLLWPVQAFAFHERTNPAAEPITPRSKGQIEAGTTPVVAVGIELPLLDSRPRCEGSFNIEFPPSGKTVRETLLGFRRLIDDCLSDLNPEFVGTVGMTTHQIEAWKNKGFGCPHFPDDTKNSCSLCYVKRSSTGAQAPPDTP